MGLTLRVYFSMFRIRLAESLQYRAAAVSGAFTSVFFGLVEIIIYQVFFLYAQNADFGQGIITLNQIITYVWLAQFLFGLQPMSIDGEIHEKIISGNVGLELCRPVDLYWHWFVKNASGRINSWWMRGGLVLLFGALLPGKWGMEGPASPGGFIAFLAAVAGAVLLCSAYAALMSVVRMGVTWGEGPTYMLMLVPGVLSGSYLPLRLWPGFMQEFLLYQPFSGYLDIPARLYLGVMPPAQAWLGLGLQLGWSLLFIALGRWLLNGRLKRLIIQGG